MATLGVVISAVALVPEPPLLVPELAGSAAAETAVVRDACRTAAALLATRASRWIAVGADRGGRRTVEPATVGSFIGFGVDVRVALDTTLPLPGPGARAGVATVADPRVDRDMPLPLLVAGWLAASTGAAVRIRGELVAPDAAPTDCIEVGRALAAADGYVDDSDFEDRDEPVGLLVVGDGAATHTEKAPGHLDPRAAGFDARVAAAFAAADTAALADLDPELAAQLWAGGRAPWQVLAGAAQGRAWEGELLCSTAPFGVGYHVAFWTPA